jgi:hypothetical protein
MFLCILKSLSSFIICQTIDVKCHLLQNARYSNGLFMAVYSMNNLWCELLFSVSQTGKYTVTLTL